MKKIVLITGLMIMLAYMGAADAAMMGGTGGVSGSMMG